MNEQTSETDDFRARARARSEAKNAAAREQLEPLAPGERPTAVTIAAILALVLSFCNVIAIFLVDIDTDNEAAAMVQQLFIAVLLLVAAIGMWNSRYWAVLGFQTMLGIMVILLFLGVLSANSVWLFLLFAALIVGFSVQFWFLIRAMARIQLPESPSERKLREYEASLEAESEQNDD